MPSNQQDAGMPEQENRGRGGMLISGGMVVTMDPDRRIFRDGAILVRGDKIEAVGRADDWGSDTKRQTASMLIIK